MTLEVETTDHKMTISRNSSGAYYSGKLYKVVKDIDDKWVAKGSETPTESSYTIEFNSSAAGSTPIKETTKATTVVKSGLEFLKDQPFSGISNSYYGEKPDLRVGKSGAAGSVTIALSELGQYNATKIILSAKQFSTGKTFAIGVNGSAKQKPGEDYTDLEFALDGSPLTSIKLNSDGYIYVRSITVVKGIDKRHNINVTEVEGGTLSASAIKAEEGTEITLTAEPQLGYEFNNDWSVTATDGTIINVVDNKFTMPAQDVTVSGTFTSNIKYDHAGTENDPYNVLDVLKLIETLGNGAKSSVINAKGVIKSITEVSTAYKNATYTIGDETTSETVTIYRGKYINGADFTSTDQIKIGDEVVIKGRVTNYNGSKQFSTGSSIVSLKRIEPCATPVITIAEGGVVSIACETAGATIHYTVDSPDDPTEADAVFSTVTLTEGQTIKAIAFAEGYKPSAVASKKYNVGGEAEEKSELINLSNGVFTDGDNPTITWSGTSCSFVQTQGSSTSKVASYTTEPRWYKSHVVSFEAKAGYKITKVVVTCKTNAYATALKGSTYFPNTTSATVSEKVVTIITNGNFEITMGAQSRISSVVVYYTNN